PVLPGLPLVLGVPALLDHGEPQLAEDVVGLPGRLPATELVGAQEAAPGDGPEGRRGARLRRQRSPGRGTQAGRRRPAPGPRRSARATATNDSRRRGEPRPGVTSGRPGNLLGQVGHWLIWDSK